MALLKRLLPLRGFHARRRIGHTLARVGLGLLLPLVATAQSIDDYTTYSTTGLPGRLYVPPTQATATTPRPFIVALHGGGGIGTDNTRHLVDFDGLLAECKARAAFLYVPQATSAYWHAGSRPELIMGMIDQAIAQYNIDPKRIIVTGFSMGGGGAWNLFARHADRFAAGVPVCGIVPGSGYVAAELVDQRVWAFHARNDPIVSVQTSRDTITGILQAASKPAPAFPSTTDTSTTFNYADPTTPLRYTEWPTGGHAIWFQVYANPALLDWMFAQSLATPPTINAHPLSATIASGGHVALTVSVEGTDPVSYQWIKDGDPITGAVEASLMLDNLTSAADGYYTVTVTNPAGSSTSRPARVLVANPVPGGLVNLSARGRAGRNGQPLIVGFVTAGGGQPLLLRAIGPSLTGLPVHNPMSDPRLDLHRAIDGRDTIELGNDDWGGDPTLVDAFAAAGAFPLPDAGSRDAAFLATVDGLRTAHVGVATGASGVVLAELYDIVPNRSRRLVNLSARNHVGTGDDVLIAGFAINGNTPVRVLIRGVGPGLTAQGVSDVLPDPYLEVHTQIQGLDTIMATNDDWETEASAVDMAAAVPAAFPLAPGARDAAILHTLPAGTFTAVVAGIGGGTGEALVEVYTVD